jgi:hypothetical protein
MSIKKRCWLEVVGILFSWKWVRFLIYKKNCLYFLYLVFLLPPLLTIFILGLNWLLLDKTYWNYFFHVEFVKSRWKKYWIWKTKRFMNFLEKLVARIHIFDRITRSTIGFNLFHYFNNHMWKEGLVPIKLLMNSIDAPTSSLINSTASLRWK